MAITSENNKSRVPILLRSTHFQYAVIYVVVTFVVLFFLNIYCSKISQEVFYNSKKTSMIEKCQLTASEIENLSVINTSSVSTAISKIGGLNATRIIVTDHTGLSLYDSYDKIPAVGKYIILPEVAKALEKNNVFTWKYDSGAIYSYAATPIVHQGALIGCVYMMEYDENQGQLIHSLQNNIYITTLILEIAVVLFSIGFSAIITKRLRRIMASMRIIREGDYSRLVEMGGNDELTALSVEYNDLIRKLQKSEQKRNQFVSDASHELKTPLASIKLLTDSILQNDMDIETIKEFVDDIGNEADRLNRMTQKLLTLSHIETQADSDCEITYIAPTIQKVIKMLTPLANTQNIEINLTVETDSPILILEDDLYQIIFNLTENGIKYNKQNGQLNITLCRHGENAIATFADTGVGIPEDAIGHIFERFYRIDKARSRASGGAGLGLAIVKNMVERNHGNISVESTKGQGSTFTVTFPCFDLEVDAQ